MINVVPKATREGAKTTKVGGEGGAVTVPPAQAGSSSEAESTPSLPGRRSPAAAFKARGSAASKPLGPPTPARSRVHPATVDPNAPRTEGASSPDLSDWVQVGKGSTPPGTRASTAARAAVTAAGGTPSRGALPLPYDYDVISSSPTPALAESMSERTAPPSRPVLLGVAKGILDSHGFNEYVGTPDQKVEDLETMLVTYGQMPHLQTGAEYDPPTLPGLRAVVVELIQRELDGALASMASTSGRDGQSDTGHSVGSRRPQLPHAPLPNPSSHPSPSGDNSGQQQPPAPKPHDTTASIPFPASLDMHNPVDLGSGSASVAGGSEAGSSLPSPGPAGAVGGVSATPAPGGAGPTHTPGTQPPIVHGPQSPLSPSPINVPVVAAHLPAAPHPQGDYAPSVRRRRPLKGEGEVVVFGDNSVAVTHTWAEPISKLSPSTCSTGDMVRKLVTSLQNPTPTKQVRWDAGDNNFVLSSQMHRASANGGWESAGRKELAIVSASGGNWVGGNYHNHTVGMASQMLSRQGALEDISAYTTGDEVDYKKIDPVIRTKLRYTDERWVRDVAGTTSQGLDTYDLSYVYAKLWWYAFCLEAQAETGHPMANMALANFTAGAVTATNLRPAVVANLYIDPAPFIDAVSRGALFFVEGYDYCAADEQIVWMLASQGERFVGTANVAVNFASMRWMVVPVHLLLQRAAGAMPAAINVGAGRVHAFIRKMATCRNDWHSAIRGLYWMLENCGIRRVNGVPPVAPAAQEYYYLNTWLSTVEPALPAPRDLHPFVRLLLKPAPCPDTALNEGHVYLQLTRLQRVQCGVIYSGALQCMLRTSLYSACFSGADLQSYLEPGAVVRSDMRDLIECMSGHMDYNTSEEAPWLPIVRNALSLMTGWAIPNWLWPGRPWLPEYGTLDADRFAAYADVLPAHGTFGRGDMRAIFSWLTKVPCEWGLPMEGTTVDLKSEVVLQGPADARGWFAGMGCRDYASAAAWEVQPQIYIPYGQLVANVLCQHLRPAAMPQLKGEACRMRDGANVRWAAPADWDHQEWDADAFVFMPGFQRTYSWTNETVIAACFNDGDPLNDDMCGTAAGWGGVTPKKVGILAPFSDTLTAQHPSKQRVHSLPGLDRRKPAGAGEGEESVPTK